MYRGALYIVPIVLFSFLYNINKFYETKTVYKVNTDNETVRLFGAMETPQHVNVSTRKCLKKKRKSLKTHF